MDNPKAWLILFLIFSGIMLSIDTVWTFLELIEFGHKDANWSDTIIGILFALSLFKNLQIKIKIGDRRWIL